MKRCRRCKRPIPRSDGDLGPVCDRIENGPTRRRSARPAPVPHAPDALPGQDQIPLFFYQAELGGI